MLEGGVIGKVGYMAGYFIGVAWYVLCKPEHVWLHIQMAYHCLRISWTTGENPMAIRRRVLDKQRRKNAA